MWWTGSYNYKRLQKRLQPRILTNLSLLDQIQREIFLLFPHVATPTSIHWKCHYYKTFFIFLNHFYFVTFKALKAEMWSFFDSPCSAVYLTLCMHTCYTILLYNFLWLICNLSSFITLRLIKRNLKTTKYPFPGMF